MAITLEQIDTFHADRGNAEWAALDAEGENKNRTAALLNALDYIEATYAPLVAEYEAQTRYLIALAILALRLAQNPETGVASPVVKSEKKEGAGFKKEVEYFEPASSDPFPGVTALIAPLQAGNSSASVTFGKMVRR